MSETPTSFGSVAAGGDQRLLDHPNWLYLLREFDSLYRHGSAGGSAAIRGHRKRVRDRLSSAMARNPEMTERASQ
ncbi:MAG TPA: hypothetical protein VKN37_09695, partial [Roseovarius sp.]|nr:hypothetical protein [Roseovarius sp.]